MGRGSGRGGDTEGTIKGCGCCCFMLFVIAAGLVGGSFQILEPTEYGIYYNTLSKELVANRVYTNGRYFVGLARDFIRYPRTRRSITFGFSNADSAPLQIRISQGQLTMDASFQYSLNVTQLVSLYRSFGNNFHSRFVSLAQSTIGSALSTGFNISDFYANREAVAAACLAALRPVFAQNFATVHDFQMRQVTLPPANEVQINNKLISEQRAQTAENVQKQQQIAAQITVVVGQVDQYIALYNANQTQLANVVLQTADARAKKLQLDAASAAYAGLQQKLNFTNPDLLRYLYLKTIKTLPPASTLAVGFQNINALVQSL